MVHLKPFIVVGDLVEEASEYLGMPPDIVTTKFGNVAKAYRLYLRKTKKTMSQPRLRSKRKSKKSIK